MCFVFLPGTKEKNNSTNGLFLRGWKTYFILILFVFKGSEPVQNKYFKIGIDIQPFNDFNTK